MDVEGLRNFRDVGGLPIVGDGATRSRRLLRSEVPRRITDVGLRTLLDLGVQTVVDLRTSTERGETRSLLADIEAVSSIHAPIFTEDDPFPTDLVTAADVNVHWVRDRAPRVAAALVAIADAPRAPVLVHCHAGKDRTGLIVALVLRLAGVGIEDVAGDYAESGVQLAETLKRDRGRAAENGMDEARLERLFTVRHDQMAESLERLEAEHGQGRALMVKLGVDVTRIDLLHALLTATSWP
ncbi:MAG: tyrosine-protein phosphatase [Candidatus Dormibacteria bacterium]